MGATGGLPTGFFLLWGIRSFNEKLEGFGTRLQRLELAFDLQGQDRVKSLADAVNRLVSRLDKLERDLETMASRKGI